MEKYLEKLKKDLFLEHFTKEFKNEHPILTGGAINDILSDRTPKDYDFIHSTGLENALQKNLTFELQYVSRTAVTYSYNGFIVQLIYKKPEEFPYTIEQAQYRLNAQTLQNFDEQSFTHKILIPNKEAFKQIIIARHALKRLLKWQDKGFKINPITYQSLLKRSFDTGAKGNRSSELDEEES